MTSIKVPTKYLRQRGVEVPSRGMSLVGSTVTLPRQTRLEAPCGLKWTQYEHSLTLGAFSYQVSGYAFAARIGRYCSFGENVQIGRQNHPMHLVSTSPAFYLYDKLFELDEDFTGSEDYHRYSFQHRSPPTRPRETLIGNDVWIGHGAYIAAGVTLSNGAIVAAHSVVTKSVPPYAVVAGNPAVIKKYRFPPEIIQGFLRARWWRFAPWQLSHLDIADPKAFIAGVEALPDDAEFTPDVISLKSYPS